MTNRERERVRESQRDTQREYAIQPDVEKLHASGHRQNLQFAVTLKKYILLRQSHRNPSWVRLTYDVYSFKLRDLTGVAATANAGAFITRINAAFVERRCMHAIITPGLQSCCRVFGLAWFGFTENYHCIKSLLIRSCFSYEYFLLERALCVLISLHLYFVPSDFDAAVTVVCI